MTRRLAIEWAPGEKVPGRLAVPAGGAAVGILLAHGAGAGQDSSWITALRDRLAAAGYVVLTFDYPYIAAGRKAPDRAPKLEACHRAAAARLADYTAAFVLSGKSMGGRIGSHVAAAGLPAAALVYYGYPLVAPGRRVPRDTGHLGEIGVPQLFLAGTRDPLCPTDLLADVTGQLPEATVELVPEGDHSFRVPKRTGRSADEVMEHLAATTATWLARHALSP